MDLRTAAQRLSDKRTANGDGFWVSKREMAYLDRALASNEGNLDAAWAEAEAALPEGWAMLELKNTGYRGESERWLAMASPVDDYSIFHSSYGDTKEEALRGLATNLRENAR